jgi:hypothetical protein
MMRLLNSRTLELKYFGENERPPYVILSHRWGEQEITLQDLISTDERHQVAVRALDGYKKVAEFCDLVAGHGIDYAWVGMHKTATFQDNLGGRIMLIGV